MSSIWSWTLAVPHVEPGAHVEASLALAWLSLSQLPSRVRAQDRKALIFFWSPFEEAKEASVNDFEPNEENEKIAKNFVLCCFFIFPHGIGGDEFAVHLHPTMANFGSVPEGLDPNDNFDEHHILYLPYVSMKQRNKTLPKRKFDFHSFAQLP